MNIVLRKKDKIIYSKFVKMLNDYAYSTSSLILDDAIRILDSIQEALGNGSEIEEDEEYDDNNDDYGDEI